MIVTTHLEKQRKHKVNKLTLSSNDYTFEIQNDENNNQKTKSTVAEYFAKTYFKLKYPDLPCVQVGDPKNPICFPLEVCQIANAQRYNKKLNPSQQAMIAKVVIRKIYYLFSRYISLNFLI